MPTSITSSGITFDDATTLTTGVLPTENIANAAVTPAKLSQPYTLATSVASTSGTAIDFTGIPSWVRRITVMFNGVSTNGTSPILIQIGSGSFTASGYSGSGSAIGPSTVASSLYSTGFGLGDAAMLATRTKNGLVQLANVSGNIWSALGSCSDTSEARTDFTSGTVLLSGALDRVRITTVGGANTFDAGTINISYEG